MKKTHKSFNKGALAIASLCMAFGTVAPFSQTYIEAQEVSAVDNTSGAVQFEKTADGLYTFGNNALKRTFSVKEGVLKTENLTNFRTDETKVLTPSSSEEFIIKTMPNIIEGKTKVEVDEAVGTGEGSINNLIDGVVSKDEADNFWASKDAKEYVEDTPLSLVVSIGSQKEVRKFKYVPRYDSGAQWDCTGRIIKADIDYFNEETQQWKNIHTDYEFNNVGETIIDLGQDVTTSKIRLTAKETYHWQDGTGSHPDNRNKVMSASEIDILDNADQSVIDRNRSEEAGVLKASDLKVAGDPEFKQENGQNVLTFTFEDKKVGGIDYSIKEVITMKDGESFMRKHLEITVPEDQADQAKIEYIDLENMDFAAEDTVGTGSNQDDNTNFWTIPEQNNNPDMGNMKGDYLELGQPYYVGAMYWGCEFPEAENKIRNGNGFVRYHYGKNLAPDTTFNNYNNYNNANGQSGKMITWDAVVGAARSTDYQVVQSDFYEYIETIATPTSFRQQFNSWYDNMKDINDSNIKASFNEIEKGFTQYGVNPLDSYVVDDGWMNYNSFWDFDRSPGKFPNELYNSTAQVNKLGSNFGLWLGPRGGYGTEGRIANYIQSHGLGSVNEQRGDINISDGRYLDKLVNDIFVNYQNKFDINYWKLDGMLLEPSRREGNYHTVTNPIATISETYERWTDMYEKMREQRDDLWINMTSYTNPSPWHLQWVNSVWMQNTGDTGFNYKFTDRDQPSMLTYRDGDYYDFFAENQWQLPNKYFYNHDPVYAKTAHKVPGSHGKQIEYSTDELREHLYMLGTRGTAFWEYYFSPSMFDDEKWQVNAEAANWIEDNFHILEKSKMFGGNPENGDVYGYSCWDGNEGIVSIRNPNNKPQKYTITLDRKLGVTEGLSNVYGKVVIGDQKYQSKDAISYGTELTYELQPLETLIIQYGDQDTTAASVESMHSDGNKVEVTFNEQVRTPEASNFKVKGKEVKEAKLNADLRTVQLTLNEEIKDTADVTVEVTGVLDVVGNATKTTATDDYYKNDLVDGIKNKDLDGTPIKKGNKYSIDGAKDFSVSGKITTESKNAVILDQERQFTVAINEEGKLVFTVNGLSVTSSKVIADGQSHLFAAVKEANGMIKVYIDGEIDNSAYDPSNCNPVLSKSYVTFADGLTGHADYITLHDSALAFDELAEMIPQENVERNVALAANNKKVKITAYDVTADKPVPEKNEEGCKFSNLNDGSKEYRHNYLELNDTNTYTDDSNKHSRYVQVDLGDEYELNKIHLTRYADGRTYGPTIIELSNDPEFKNSKQIFNSDTTGEVHKRGKGNGELYPETQAGKEFTFEKTNARYIRIYVNGVNNGGTSDHLVELEAYGIKVEGAEDEKLPISPDRGDSSVDPEQGETPETVVDKSKLEAAIKDAKKLSEKKYTAKSWKVFVQALADAQAVYDDSNATQKQVDDALQSLLKAISDLKPIDGDKKPEGTDKTDGTNTATRTFVSLFGTGMVASIGGMLALIESKRRKMDRE